MFSGRMMLRVRIERHSVIVAAICREGNSG